MGLNTNEIIIRILLALIIGGLIGYERELQNRSAGLRTHILVCLGATIVSLLQIQIGNQAIEMIAVNKELSSVINIDYGRLGAQVITGVGFIGAGSNIESFVYIGMGGFSQAVVTFTSQNIGAGRQDNIGKIMFTALGLSTVLGLIISLLVVFRATKGKVKIV